MTSKRKHTSSEEAQLPISLTGQTSDAVSERPKWKRTGRTNTIMTDDHKEILMRERSRLVSNMMLSDSVLNELISVKVLSVDEMQQIIRNDATDCVKVQNFLNIFNRKPDSAYSLLINALNNDHQEHVSRLLDPEQLSEADLDALSSYQIETEPSNLIKRVYLRLLQLLDLESGVLDDLLSQDIISQRQYDNWYELTTSMKNEEFLNFLIANCPASKFPAILKILNDCHQRHVTNFITAGGKIDPNSQEERALTEDEVKRITANQKALMDLLPSETIVPIIAAKNIITKRHCDVILRKETQADKNRKFLEIIKKRSFSDVVRFCKILDDHQLSHLSKAIQGCGVMPIIHAKQDSPQKKARKLELAEEEREICSEVNEFTTRSITDDDNERHQYCRDMTKLRDRNITIVNAAPTGSIAVYLICETKQALHDVWNMMQTGVLRKYLESIFTGKRRTKIDLTLNVDPEEFCKMFDYPWAADADNLESESTEITDDMSDKRLDAIDILELVRLKQMTVKEAEFHLRQLCTTGIAGEELEPPIIRRCLTRPSPQSSATSLFNPEAWRQNTAGGSFVFYEGTGKPVFGSS